MSSKRCLLTMIRHTDVTMCSKFKIGQVKRHISSGALQLQGIQSCLTNSDIHTGCQRRHFSLQRSHNPSNIIKTGPPLLHRNCVRTLYSLVQPQKVSSVSHVPEHIKRPMYVQTGSVPAASKPIPLKTQAQVEGMKAACSLASSILAKAGEAIRVGVTTDEIDQLVHRLAIENSAYPSPLLYKGFPKSVCTSVNNVACHGIPDSRPLMDGDIINVDVTVYLNGYHGDCSKTYLVGNVDKGGQLLVDVARRCRDAGVAVCKPGIRFCEIGNAISSAAHSAGFSVIPEFCGHGIGENFHEKPDILHFEHHDNAVMAPRMTFTVEPIICSGQPDFRILEDGWTAVTLDSCRSAQFEHTVLITEDGAQILTL
ncbi:methionine aminopeptidase 1D, mitochondrial-like [Haliotis cracherodii]|uniref:methionine aminopeptidase 1D, mitochondrial-like n=1 Tax=Haliotis cracherodii TaxID=6455 RepID=UPI0039E83981